MVEVNIKPEDLRADLSLPEGCPTCGGPVSVRVRPMAAGAFCGACHRSWRPKVKMTPQGIMLMHPMSVG